jgi:tetratricopeptide (TPR) repeat protein
VARITTATNPKGRCALVRASLVPAAILLALSLMYTMVALGQTIQAESNPKLDDLLGQARKDEQEQKYAGAERVYAQALAMAPEDPEVLKRAGVLYQTELKFNQSIDLLQRALKLNPGYPDVEFFLGASYLGLNDLPRAVEAFHSELENPHPHPRCRYYLGVALESSGRMEEALAEFDRAVSENPKDADSLYELALIHKNASLKAIDQLREIDPDSFQIHRLMGEIYADDERYGKAVKEYQAALEKRPDDAGLHYAIGIAYWAQHQMDPAQQEFSNALRQDPNNPLIKLYLADIAVKQQRFDDAQPYLRAAEAALPGMSRVHVLLGRCYRAAKDLARAETEFERAAQLDPSDPRPHYLLAETYRELGKPRESARELAEFEALSEAANDQKLAALDRQWRAEE